ncbi:hypothetical protein PanWU01x14_369530 [Parasponia andersonii]|uniref:Uncharacterized protein n=1 Tax=Parasponia andersonii TaxID=3476 RepID=A0A2P5A4N8_PARAD|nr:hypothetical protein PanWU01x14_369530 [Parasponia andersonii]
MSCFLEQMMVAWTWEASNGVTIRIGFAFNDEENRGFFMEEFSTEKYDTSFGVWMSSGLDVVLEKWWERH